MEYEKIINLLENTPNQPSKFRTKNWVKINDDSRGTYDTNRQIKLKTSILKSSLSDYIEAYYILVKEIITVPNIAVATAASNNGDEKVIFKNCTAFTDCASKINNTHIDNSKDIAEVMQMCSLIEYSDNYPKTQGRLWQYCRDKPAVNNNGVIIGFNVANVTDSFKFKKKITGQTDDNGTKDVEILVPLKYLNNFWRTLKMSLTNCEINLILTWPANCVIIANAVPNHGATFAKTDTKLCFSCNFIN